MEWFDIINILGSATPSILIGVFLASMALLAAKNKISFPVKYGWILWVCLIFSGSLLVGIGIVKGYERILIKIQKNDQYAILDSLTIDEKKTLQSFIEKETLRRCFNIRKRGPLKALERDGVVYNTSEDQSRSYCYNIERWAYYHLLKHPELLTHKSGKGEFLSPPPHNTNEY